MVVAAKTIQWRILIWMVPLQIIVFIGFQFWLESYLNGTVDPADPSPLHESHNTIRIASAVVGVLILLVSFVTVRLQIDRHLRRPTRRILAKAKAIRRGEPHTPANRSRPRELRAIADELNRSAKRISRQNREIQENERLVDVGQIAAGMSHTLKNVLNGLRAGQFVLDRALKTGDQEKLQKGLDVTRSSVRRIERLIFDMLSYAKEREPQREILDPNEILQEVADELQQMAKSWEVELSAELDPKVGLIALDRLAIYRALMDLTTNAIEACAEGGPGDRVVLSSRGAPNEVVLTVKDRGCGMTDEQLKSLYTRFVSSKATGGTGLGMVVVKKIIDEHKGTIEVESIPGQGTVFDIHLPKMNEVETAEA